MGNKNKEIVVADNEARGTIASLIWGNRAHERGPRMFQLDKVFIVAGKLYLKFLKDKPWTRKATAIEDVAEAGVEKGKDELLKPIKPDDVIAWLVTQRNANGTLYLENVARSYISSLRSAPPKLALTLENRDVFSCHTVAELDALWDAFRGASNKDIGK